MVSLGAVIHALLTVKAALRRLLRRRPKAGAGRRPRRRRRALAAGPRAAWLGAFSADDGGLTEPAAYAPRAKARRARRARRAPGAALPRRRGGRPAEAGDRAAAEAQLKFAFSPRGD